MLATKEIIQTLIPQRPPMVMVDSLDYQDEHITRSSFYIENDNLFNTNGLFSEEGMIENIAQSAALRVGWIGREKSQGGDLISPPIGVIGAVKNFKLYRLAEVNTNINTEIVFQTEIFNAILVYGKILQADELLAEVELKIFIQDQQV
ncbi:MAG: hydroxymyristoyl-ACP dehydratase [Bacteroidota bacterium]